MKNTSRGRNQREKAGSLFAGSCFPFPLKLCRQRAPWGAEPGLWGSVIVGTGREGSNGRTESLCSHGQSSPGCISGRCEWILRRCEHIPGRCEHILKRCEHSLRGCAGCRLQPLDSVHGQLQLDDFVAFFLELFFLHFQCVAGPESIKNTPAPLWLRGHPVP